MIDRLPGKIALITGSGRGLGSTLATELAGQGMRVVVNYLKAKTAAQKTADTIRQKGGTCLLLQADLRRTASVHKMVERIDQEWGGIDILIHAVGNFMQKPLLETDIEEWRDLLDSNLNSAFIACKKVIPLMRKRGSGRIITIGLASASTIHAYRDITPVAIAKTGLLILTQSLAREVAAQGITVNCVSPGHLLGGSLPPTVDPHSIPMQRFGKADDLLAAIRFLISDEAAYITGSNILVSGGWGF